MSALPNFNRFPGMGDLSGDSSNPNSPDYDNEAADHRQEMADSTIATLRELPKLLGEVALDEAQARRAALALSKGDAIEFTRIFTEARDTYADELIEQTRNEHPWMGECEAAERLCVVYA